MNPTRNNYDPMTVTGENRYSTRMNSTRYAYTQMTVTRETGIVWERRSSTLQIWPNDRDGGKPVLSGKRYLPCRKYGPMTETNGKSVFTGYGSYASRVHTNDRDGGRLVLTVKGKPVHNEYGPMTKTRFLAVMYKNKNEKSEIVLCELVLCL